MPRPESSRRAAISSNQQVEQSQRQAERGQRRGEQHFEQLVSGVRDYAIFLLDRDGRVSSWNAGAERIKGYTAGEIVGQHFSRFYPEDVVASGWPDHELKIAAETGRFEDEGWRIRKDGSRFWANVVITALRDDSGELHGFLKITRDLTYRKQDEEKHRQSEERFRLLVDRVQDYAIFMLDPEGRVATWNAGAQRLKGYTADEIIGQHFSRFYPQEAIDRGWPAEELRRVLRDGRIEDEGWRLRKDGSRFWANVVITALRDDSGTLRGFAKVTRDLTERRQAEENTRRLLQEEAARKAAEEAAREIERQREQLHVTLSSIGDAVIVTDEKGNVTFLNPVARELTGWNLDEATGRPLEEVFPIINEQTRQPLENPVRQAMRDGKVVQLANHTTLVCRTSREVPIEDSAAPIRERDGSIGGSVLVFRDVTEARRAMEARLYLAAIVESSDDAIIGETLDGKIASWNRGAERLYGYTATEAVGRPVALLAPSDHPDEQPAILERIKRGEYIEHFETVRVRKDGSRVDVSLTLSPVRNSDGQITGASKIARDITEQKRARAALRKSEERLAAELEAMTRLHALSTRLFGSVDLHTALDDVLQEALHATRADFGNVQLYNPRSRALEIAVHRGFQQNFLDHFREVHLDSGSACARAMQTGVRTIVEDVESEESYALHRAIAAEAGLRAVQSTPLKGRSGNVIGVLSTYYRQPHRPSERDERFLDLYARHATDLIERLGIEEDLRRSEARFRQLADAMPQLVWAARADGHIDYYNRRWHEFTGSTDVEGSEGWPAIIHPGDMPAASERWGESLRSGIPFETEIRLLDRGTGSYRWHLMRTVPAKDGNGTVVRWYGTATDINSQKRSAETSHFLADVSAALATLVDFRSTLQKVVNLAVPYFADWSAVDLADDGGVLRRLAVAHTDPGKIRLVQQLSERYPADPSRGAGQVLATGRPELVEEISDQMLASAAQDEQHLQLIHSLGLRSYLCVPLIVSGKTIGVMTFATAESGRRFTVADRSLAEDLSRRIAVAVENASLYQELREEDRRKTEFLALLAHEIRNPLAPLRNGLEVMRAAGDDRHSAERARAMMERQLAHLMRLVDDLLDVSRISRGKIELRRERLALAAVVDSALELCQPLVTQQRDELVISLPDEPVYVHADPTRLAQALSNLLSNAAKYSDPGSTIWLTVRREGNEAIISVRDTGIGIPAKMLPKVFDLFTRVDQSLERSQGGLGVGLTIVRRLIELHGGRVEAHSDGPSKGSEFVIHLPVLAALAAEPAPEPNVRTTKRDAPRRVLVVDDHADAADSLAMMIRLLGHEVRVARNGREGVETAATFHPQLVLLDIGMPIMNGYDACRQIRELPDGREMTIAALTGWGQDEDKRRSQDAGFDAHLVKPVEPGDLEVLLSDVRPRQ